MVRKRVSSGPAIRAYGLRANLRGGAIRVRWKTSRRVSPTASFDITASATRSRFEDPLIHASATESKPGRPFTTTITPAAGIRFVTLYPEPLKQTVRVRR